MAQKTWGSAPGGERVGEERQDQIARLAWNKEQHQIQERTAKLEDAADPHEEDGCAGRDDEEVRGKEGGRLNPSTPSHYKNAGRLRLAISVLPHFPEPTMAHASRIPRVVPLFEYKGDRSLSSPAAHAARLRLDSHTVQFYDFFYEVYQRGRIIPTFRQSLSQEQSQYLIFVKTLSDWTDSDDAVTFQQEVDLYKFLTFDLEQIKPDREATERVPLFKRRRIDQDRHVYAVFGTITGRVVIFDLEECYNGPVDKDDPLATVPPEFRAWIKSPEVIIAGSGVDKDLEEAGLEAHKVLNMQDVFARHLVARDDSGPLIDMGNNRRSGLGIQAYYAKDMDYKPMTARRYTESYGGHRYRDDGGRLKWPAWRHHDHLYRWYKDRQGNLRDESLFYMWHDGSCPASVVSKIFLDTCQRHPVVVREANVAEFLDTMLGPDYKRVGGLEILHIDAPELEQEFGEEPGPAGEPAPEVQPKMEPELEEGEVQDEDVQVVDIQPPEKILREGKPREGTVFAYWDWRRERENPYVTVPGLARLCNYCARGKHSYKHKSGAIMCEAALEDDQETDICTYRRCDDKRSHRIAACPMLHHRCAICHHRGHDEEARCWEWSDEEWKRARDDFEELADFGVLTTSRRRDERWGWWGHLRRTPFPYFAPYPALLDMDWREVDEKLGLRPKIPRSDGSGGITITYVTRGRGRGRGHYAGRSRAAGRRRRRE